MFFSVIIPTCNRSNLLAICLNKLHDAVANCTIQDIEVIVTDDSENSVTKAMIENNYQWVQWVQGPQRGPAANRNNGAKQAKGEWLVFLDDDCEPDTSLLVEYEKSIKENMNYVVFEGAIFPLGDRKSPLDYGPFNTEGGHLWSCNFCIENVFFKRLNGFDEIFKYPHLEDNDLRLRILNIGFKILFLNKAIVKHPWKKLNDGKRLGSFQEMSIYFYRKHKIQYSLVKICLSILRIHGSMIIKNLFSKDTIKAFQVMFYHVSITIKNYSYWNKIYKNKI